MKKFQLGGNIYAREWANDWYQTRSLDTTTSASSSSNEGLLSDSLLKDLRGNGIPVDYDAFMSQVGDIEHRLSMGLPVSPRKIREIETKANRVIQQNNYLKKAEEQASKNNALGEVAVGNRGQLYTLTEKGDIKQVSLQDYDYEKNGPALTVNELLENRKFNPSQAFDTTLTQTIGNSIGMQNINDYIMQIISKVGSAQTAQEAYIDLASYVGREAAKKPSEQELLNLQALYQAVSQVGPDAIFKSKEVRESKNLQDAFKYIQSVLPRNMQVQLQGRYVAAGGDLKDSAGYIQNLISQSLYATNDTKVQSSLDFDAAINKAAGTKAGASAEQKRNLKNLEVLVQGSLGKIDYNLTSSKNPSVGMQLHGTVVGALTNFDNNIVPKAPMSLALESSIGPLIDKQHMTMGNQKITEGMLDSILYDGNDVINVWAPVDQNGDIDLNGLKIFNDLLTTFNQDPSLTVADKNRILQQYGINGQINEDGSFTGSGNMAQFLVFTGITSDKVIDENQDFVDKLSGDTKKFELEQIERIYGALNSKKEYKKNNIEFRKGLFDFTTDILKAPVFMKLRPTAQEEVGTFSNHGPLVMTPTYQTQVTQDQLRYQRQNEQQIQKPSTSLIYQ